MNIAQYRKLVAALVAAFAVIGAAASDGTISAAEAVQTLAAFLGAFGVYLFKNEPLD